MSSQLDLLAHAQELEKELLALVFKEPNKDEPLDWEQVNSLLSRRDSVHRELAQPDELSKDVKDFLQQALDNTNTLRKLAADVQDATQQELIKIEKGRKAHHAYY